MRYLLLIRGDESAAAHADEGCFGWSERMAERGEAVEVAAQHPAAGYGTIEVRELWPPQ